MVDEWWVGDGILVAGFWTFAFFLNYWNHLIILKTKSSHFESPTKRLHTNDLDNL